MKNRYTLKSVYCTITALLLCSTALATSFPSLVNTTKNTKPTYLFTIHCKQATLEQQTNKNMYTLTIPLSEIKHVLMFTDRPYRAAEYITPAKFAKIIHKKSHQSFDKIKPNIVISFGDNLPPAAFKIEENFKANKVLTYDLQLLSRSHTAGQFNYKGSVTIFYDSLSRSD